MAKILYKTSEEIEAEAKREGREYVSYSYEYGDPKQRVITAERRQEIAAIQQKFSNVEFECFLDAIYAIPLPDEIITLIEDSYYGNPTYALAIAATSKTINLDMLLNDLKSAQGYIDKQMDIVSELLAQIRAAAMKGIFRDYFSGLIGVQNGCEGRASRAFMGNYRLFYEYGAIYTGTEFTDEVYIAFLQLIDNIKTDLKLIRSMRDKITTEQYESLVKHSYEIMIGYVNKYLSKVGKKYTG